MQNGRNPSRRNRNIGTPKQGHGQDNRQRIAEPQSRRRDCAAFYEHIGPFNETTFIIGRHHLRCIVEHSRDDTCHTVTVDDLERMLGWLPSDDIAGIRLILLRQPKRREELLRPVWGRIVFDCHVLNYQGPCLMLEAADLGSVWKWGHHLKPDDQRELQRYRDLGFNVTQTKRHHEIRPTIDAVRAMQLYHTLPHEIGHWVQYRDVGPERFERIPIHEREDFAHRYADTFRGDVKAIGHLPFERLISTVRLMRHGLRQEDFVP